MAYLLFNLAVLFVILNIIAPMQIDLVKYEWNLFKEKYSKSFADHIEEESRFKIFAENMKTIEEHNKLFEEAFDEFLATKVGYTENNKRTLTRKNLRRIENKEKYNGTSIRKQLPKRVEEDDSDEETEIPKFVDWRTKDVVTPVQDQKDCEAGWAFSAGQTALKTFILEELSPQQLIDCDWGEGNWGCIYGRAVWAFDYLIDNEGIATEAFYPYERVKRKCRYDKYFLGSEVYDYVSYRGGYEEQLQEDVAKVGPIAIAFKMHPSIQHYSEGVYYEAECEEYPAYHGMLVVGYGTTEEDEDYWIVKNSWSEAWGEQGYVRVARNRNNTCGIASDCSYPLVN